MFLHFPLFIRSLFLFWFKVITVARTRMVFCLLLHLHSASFIDVFDGVEPLPVGLL